MVNEPPASRLEAAGRVATEVVGGLKQQPVILALVVLNVVAISGALWFLHETITVTAHRTEMILKACLPGAAG